MCTLQCTLYCASSQPAESTARGAARGDARAVGTHFRGLRSQRNPCRNRCGATGSRDVWHAIHTTNCGRYTRASPNRQYCTSARAREQRPPERRRVKSEGTESASRAIALLRWRRGQRPQAGTRTSGQPDAPGRPGTVYCTVSRVLESGGN